MHATSKRHKPSYPSAAQLLRTPFGKPSKDHSFTQEACFETILFHILSSEFLDRKSRTVLLLADETFETLDSAITEHKNIDFSPLAEYDPNWESQASIPQDRVTHFTACLFHYGMQINLVYRYAGNNYTAAYRHDFLPTTLARLKTFLDPDLLEAYKRVITSGAPCHLVAETTRENALLHLNEGNHKSIEDNLGKVMSVMNKEEKNNYVIPFDAWLAKFIPHSFFTPQHLLQKAGKKDRLIYDATRKFTETSIPLNEMTSTLTEPPVTFGDTKLRILKRVWNLRITYPSTDILIHANDYKSCFRQLKHHPDILAGFAYIISTYLFFPTGMTFGSNISVANWESVRRVAEKTAVHLFADKTLRTKHRAILDQLRWSKPADNDTIFIKAKRDSKNEGVLDKVGLPVPTPHHYFVDDGIYADAAIIERLEQTCAAGVESIYLLLGEPDLARRQNSCELQKLYKMMISYTNKILGHTINTRTMDVETPEDYVNETVTILNTTWHAKRKSFTLHDALHLTGRLNYIAETMPWLHHLMSHLYSSLAGAIRCNKAHLISTNRAFKELLATTHETPTTHAETQHHAFAVRQTSRAVYNLRKPHFLNTTAIRELDIIRKALSSPHLSHRCPIAHLIPRVPDGVAWGDSCLTAAGGWSTDYNFWWHLEWPEEIRKRTLLFIKDGSTGRLISINALEYATIIINYAAVTAEVTPSIKEDNPFPTTLLMADNKSGESWTIKGCKTSLAGRALGRLQCAYMIGNPIGINVEYVNTKDNIIADKISRIDKATHAFAFFQSLVQEYPQLKSCRRFHPSAELLSHITAALLQGKLLNPLALGQQLRNNPGKFTT